MIKELVFPPSSLPNLRKRGISPKPCTSWEKNFLNIVFCIKSFIVWRSRGEDCPPVWLPQRHLVSPPLGHRLLAWATRTALRSEYWHGVFGSAALPKPLPFCQLRRVNPEVFGQNENTFFFFFLRIWTVDCFWKKRSESEMYEFGFSAKPSSARNS